MSSTSTMQPNAHAMAGSMRRRTLPTMLPNTLPERLPGGRVSAIQVESVPDAQQPDRAEAYGCQQHHALEQRLPQRFDVEHEQQVADGAEHQRAKDRTDRAARTAEQRHSAQHDRSDRIQRVGTPVGG